MFLKAKQKENKSKKNLSLLIRVSPLEKVLRTCFHFKLYQDTQQSHILKQNKIKMRKWVLFGSSCESINCFAFEIRCQFWGLRLFFVQLVALGGLIVGRGCLRALFA